MIIAFLDKRNPFFYFINIFSCRQISHGIGISEKINKSSYII